MPPVFAFGERVAGFDIPVLNEREVRAGAGILFALALVSFMHAWLLGDFRPVRVFVVAFLVDFSLRIFVNPRFAPSLVLGRLMVRWQAPEYAGAPQKRFAWAVGWALAVLMAWLVVVERVVGPLNLIVCLTCLTLMFFEAAFGICLACKIYNACTRQTARHCPGGVCETRQPLRISLAEGGVGVASLAVVAALAQPLLADSRDAAFQAARQAAPVTPPTFPIPAPVSEPQAGSQPENCTPPDWAVKMGHAEQWKLHHNCL